MSKPLQAIIVGDGHRAQTYANYALSHPEQLQIVGLADPTPLRRQQTAAQFNLRPEQCYELAEALAALPQCADFITNGTMDHQHVPTAIPLLERGYHMLLEKPFATSENELPIFLDRETGQDRDPDTHRKYVQLHRRKRRTWAERITEKEEVTP